MFKALIIFVCLVSLSMMTADMLIVRKDDQELYSQLHKSSKAKHISFACEQNRQGVSRLIWQEKSNPCFTRIDSDHSILHLARKDKKIEFVENMEHIHCSMQDETGQKTIISSDKLEYEKEAIFLSGNVRAEHPLGMLTAHSAYLKKDADKHTSFDYPWIDLTGGVTLKLSNGSSLQCDEVRIDHIKKTAELLGHIVFIDTQYKVAADRAHIAYADNAGSYVATQIDLFDQVQLARHSTSMQYALADRLSYLPQENYAVLEQVENRVLFYDKEHNLHISARKVIAQKDAETKKERVEGSGDVRVIFEQQELAKIEKFLKP